MQIVPGRGLTARVEGHDCLLGNEALFREFFIALARRYCRHRNPASRASGWRSIRSRPRYFDARDALRPDAADAVAALRRAGLRVLMLTGDTAAAAAPIAQARQAFDRRSEAG